MQLSNVLLHSFGFSKEPVARVSSTGSLLCGAISKPLCPPFPGARPAYSLQTSAAQTHPPTLTPAPVWCSAIRMNLAEMLHREHLTPLSFCPSPVRLGAPLALWIGGLSRVLKGFPLFIVTLDCCFKAFLNQEPKACGRGLTSPLVLHDLKWAPLHSTTGPGQPQ